MSLFDPDTMQSMASDRKRDDSKLAADQVSQAWREKGRRVPTFEDSPLFNRQLSLQAEPSAKG